MSETQSGSNNSSNLLVGYIILGLLAVLVYGGWMGISKAIDYFSSSHAAAAAPDPRDERIKKLETEIEELKSKPAEHHYELRDEGSRTWRFDPATGDSCIKLTTKADWKKPETMRQSCDYEDYIAANPTDLTTYNQAECFYVNNQKACEALSKTTHP